MEFLFAPSAGIGRVLGSDSEWIALDALQDPERVARFSVDPRHWTLEDLLGVDGLPERLHLQRDRLDAFRLAMIVLDSGTNDRTTRLAVEALEDLLSWPEIESEVRKWLTAFPLPLGELPPKERPAATGARAAALFDRLREVQSLLSVLWRAWPAVPEGLFGEAGRQAFYSALVSTGSIENLVDGMRLHGRVELNRVDLIAGGVLSRRWPDYLAILRIWLDTAAGTLGQSARQPIVREERVAATERATPLSKPRI